MRPTPSPRIHGRVLQALMPAGQRLGTRVARPITRACCPRNDWGERPPEGRLSLNKVLVHAGLRVNDKGQVARLKAGAAATLDEAAVLIGRIRTELRRPNTHPEVERYCTEELLAKNNFHAVFEAAKSVPDRLRAMTGVDGDGAEVVRATLLPADRPLVAINAGITKSDRSEQAGLANVALGLVGLYRNPTAHDPKIRRTVSDDELLEALTTMSMVHRRLDQATVSTP